MGNIAVQLIALGEIKDLKEARRIVEASETLKQYTPEAPQAYAEAYQRFLKAIGLEA